MNMNDPDNDANLLQFDHTTCAQFDGELSDYFADHVPYAVQRAAFHLFDAIDEARTDKARLLGLLDLLGPNWLGIIGRLDGVMHRYGATVADLVDPDDYAQARGRIEGAGAGEQ